MAVMHIVALVWPTVLLAQHIVLVGPACLYEFLGDVGSIDSILHFPSAPFVSIVLGGLTSSSALFSMFWRTSRRALVLIVIEQGKVMMKYL
jgi:hypothetical protein